MSLPFVRWHAKLIISTFVASLSWLPTDSWTVTCPLSCSFRHNAAQQQGSFSNLMSSSQSNTIKRTYFTPIKATPTGDSEIEISSQQLDDKLATIDTTMDDLVVSDDLFLDDNTHVGDASIRSGYNRFYSALPKLWLSKNKDEQNLDRIILATAIPSMINLAVVPIVNSVDTFWVGRMGITLALAGQAAANQVFFTIYFLVAFVPTITAPLVAAAIGSGDDEQAQRRVSEALFLSVILGSFGTLLLVFFPRTGLGLVLSHDAPAVTYAAPYLRWRALSMIPALVSATGFAVYRGLLNTMTPLKISLAVNALNVVLDPLLMFNGAGSMGFCGAALATAIAETLSGIFYMKRLLQLKLTKWSLLFTPPSWKSILPLIQGGAAMLARQLLAINIGLVSAARRAQMLDPSGVSAAAYGIVMQLYAVGIVTHVAVQGTAAAIVSSAMATSGKQQARHVADRIFVWGSIVGLALGLTQFLALPALVPLFSTVPQVRQAVQRPALVASLLHVINGFVFAGEGTMMGLGCFKDLALFTAAGIGTMIVCLQSPLGKTLEGILMSMVAFCSLQAVAMLVHHLKLGPLSTTTKNVSSNYNR